MSHPYQMGLDTAGIDRLIAKLYGDGLETLERLYSPHAQAQNEYALHVTGGSDFYGERVKPGISLKNGNWIWGGLLDCRI